MENIDLTKLSTEELVGMQMDFEQKAAEVQGALRAVRSTLAYRVNESRKGKTDSIMEKLTQPVARAEQLAQPPDFKIPPKDGAKP